MPMLVSPANYTCVCAAMGAKGWGASYGQSKRGVHYASFRKTISGKEAVDVGKIVFADTTERTVAIAALDALDREQRYYEG